MCCGRVQLMPMPTIRSAASAAARASVHLSPAASCFPLRQVKESSASVSKRSSMCAIASNSLTDGMVCFRG